MADADPDLFVHAGGPAAAPREADTLEDFRKDYLRQLGDEDRRAFNARVPQVWQWEDREAPSGWADARLSGPVLAAAQQAFLESAPMRWPMQDESERLRRRLSYGRLLDLFVLERRAPDDSWLEQALQRSQAIWKVVLMESRVDPLAVDEGNVLWLSADVHDCAAHQAKMAVPAGAALYGQVEIDPRGEELVVSLRDAEGYPAFTRRLTASGRSV
jgi:phosphodiesterase/alkaline phosphatase D-like protein